MTEANDKVLAQTMALEDSYVMHTYGRKQVEFVRGEGCRLWDSAGKEYLDCLAGIGSVSLGHAHPALVGALQEQAAKLVQVGNYYYIEHRAELAEHISDMLCRNAADALGNTGESWRTFFANSGAEANEGAIKLARAYANKRGTGAYTVLAARRSFHGRTLATLFATGQAAKQEPFVPAVEGFVHVPLNDIDALKEAVANPSGAPVGAVMLECVQGEGGVYPCDREYLRAVREFTLENDILLILDEVQTGIFRTGMPFAFQNFDIVPDIVSIAKGMGGGVPIGAFCARESIASFLEPGEHGSTFGGNPLVCAASLAVLETMDEIDIGAHVREVGAYLAQRLETLPHVKEVRGMGLMLAAELDGAYAGTVVAEGLEQGLVLNQVSAETLRYLMPLICEKDDIDLLISRLTGILEKL